MAKWIYGFCEVGSRPLSQEERAMLHHYEVAARWKVAALAVLSVVGGFVVLLSVCLLATLPRSFWLLFILIVAVYICVLWRLGQSDLSRLATRQVLKAGFVTRFERQEMPEAVFQAYRDLELQNDWEDDADKKVIDQEVQLQFDAFERTINQAAGGEVTWFETIGDSETLHSVEGLRLTTGPAFSSIEIPEPEDEAQ